VKERGGGERGGLDKITNEIQGVWDQKSFGTGGKKEKAGVTNTKTRKKGVGTEEMSREKQG